MVKEENKEKRKLQKKKRKEEEKQLEKEREREQERARERRRGMLILWENNFAFNSYNLDRYSSDDYRRRRR